MQLRTIFTLLCMTLMAGGVAVAAPQLKAESPRVSIAAEAGFNLQDAINKAQAGDTVRVPAGTYHGSFTLGEGVTLIGAGPGQSILDGTGHEAVIKGANNSMVVGFTIRGAKAGVITRGAYAGIFQNVIENNQQMGVHVIGGSAVIANNVIRNNGGLGGVAVNSGNPYIINNTFVDNPHNGVWAWYNPGPTLMNNVISGSNTAVLNGAGAEVRTAYNVIDTPRHLASGELHGTDVVASVEFTDRVAGDFSLLSEELQGVGYAQPDLNPSGMVGVAFDSTPSLEKYRELMSDLLVNIVAEHPSVRYDLTGDLGSFLVTTRFPNSTFSVRSSTKDTVVEDVYAFDSKTDYTLSAELKTQNDFPLVFVNDRSFEEKSTDRYVLENLYYHPGSYYDLGKGIQVFERETSFSRIEVALPAGYVPVSVNLPATFDIGNDGRVLVKISDMGITNLRIAMAPESPLTTDVYGIESLRSGL